MAANFVQFPSRGRETRGNENVVLQVNAGNNLHQTFALK